MTPDELDTAYTALCEALGRAGTEKTPLLLATLALELLARETDAPAALRSIERAERLSRD